MKNKLRTPNWTKLSWRNYGVETGACAGGAGSLPGFSQVGGDKSPRMHFNKKCAGGTSEAKCNPTPAKAKAEHSPKGAENDPQSGSKWYQLALFS